jgi:hypothetical protein
LRSSVTSYHAKAALTISVASHSAPRRRMRNRIDGDYAPNFVSLSGVGHDQRHQVMRGQHAQGARRAGALGEQGDGIGATVAAPHQHGHRLPAVGRQNRGRGVIAADHEHVRPELSYRRNEAVESFEASTFASNLPSSPALSVSL